MVLGLGLGKASSGDGDGVAGSGVLVASRCHAGVRREHLDTCTFANDLQLVDRTGTLQVARHQQGRISLSAKPFGELAGQGGLTGALQTGQHDHRRRGLGEGQLTGLARRGSR